MVLALLLIEYTQMVTITYATPTLVDVKILQTLKDTPIVHNA
jgi:hypothetical protein